MPIGSDLSRPVRRAAARGARTAARQARKGGGSRATGTRAGRRSNAASSGQTIKGVKLTYYDYRKLCGSNPGSYSSTCKALAANNHYAAANFGKIGERVQVSYKGRSTTVTILDRGGGVPMGFMRWMDLSPQAFADLAPLSQGVIKGAVITRGKGSGTYDPKVQDLAEKVAQRTLDAAGKELVGVLGGDCSGLIDDPLDWIRCTLPTYLKIAAGGLGLLIMFIALLWVVLKDTAPAKAVGKASSLIPVGAAAKAASSAAGARPQAQSLGELRRAGERRAREEARAGAADRAERSLRLREEKAADARDADREMRERLEPEEYAQVLAGGQIGGKRAQVLEREAKPTGLRSSYRKG